MVASHYSRLGLTLTHYDARGHLVVARRIADSITPGWQQIGAVWLPLPHLLNAIPVQVDLFYRSGASAVAISVAAFAVATVSIASIVLTLTESSLAAIAAAAVFALNPNVLYLQSTPMTEPLLMALTTLGVAMLVEWCLTTPVGAELARPNAELFSPTDNSAGPQDNSVARRDNVAAGDDNSVAGADDRVAGRASSAPTGEAIGWIFALACMTRYEAWPITVCAIAAAAWTLHRRGMSWIAAGRTAGRIGFYPGLAILAFIVFSRVVIGEWFVGGEFYVPENKALNDLSMAAAEIGWGARALSGTVLAWIAGAGITVIVAVGLGSRRRAHALIAVSLAAAATIPCIAFYKGHPFRIRYMVPLMAMEAVAAGMLAGVFRRGRVMASCVVLGIAAFELRPLDHLAPMVVEAQWDRPNLPVRAKVTACLDGPGGAGKIMASMGSLGHYMQETSADGYAIHNFLHEGNGDIWLAALNNPRPFAEWVLIEEKAEGGDMLARLARERPAFLAGYARVCEGAGLALYRRQPLATDLSSSPSRPLSPSRP
jgi:hypothetical protein